MVCRAGNFKDPKRKAFRWVFFRIANMMKCIRGAGRGYCRIFFRRRDGSSRPSGAEYGRGRLAQVVRRAGDLAPRLLVEEIFADLERFNVERFDDQTLIVMRVA